MSDVDPFETSALEYDGWYDRHPLLYRSELAALREVVPMHGKGLEIGVGTGRFAAALNISTGIEPARAMAEIAKKRGVHVINGTAEQLPFPGCCFDFVLFVTTVCFLKDPLEAFKEAHRVLKEKGAVITGFIDKESEMGQLYEKKKDDNKFYKHARFLGVEQMVRILEQAGFGVRAFYQTLTKPGLTEIEPPLPGYGKGSFVVLQAEKFLATDERR
jgi:SAM-dependent methyltransferase